MSTESWTPTGIVSKGAYISMDTTRFSQNGLDHIILARQTPLSGPTSVAGELGLADLFDILNNSLDNDLMGIIDTLEGIVLVPNVTFDIKKLSEPFSKRPFYIRNKDSGVMGGREHFSIPSINFNNSADAVKFFEFGDTIDKLGMILESVESAAFPGQFLFFAQMPNGDIEVHLCIDRLHGQGMQCFTPESAGALIHKYREILRQTFSNPLFLGETVKKMQDANAHNRPVTTEMLKLMVKRDASVVPDDCCGIFVNFANSVAEAIFIPSYFEKAPVISGNIQSPFKHNGKTFWFKRGHDELNAYLIFRTLRRRGGVSIGVPIRGCLVTKNPGSKILAVYVIIPDVLEQRPGYVSGYDVPKKEVTPYLTAKINKLIEEFKINPIDENTQGNHFFNPETKGIELIDFEKWDLSRMSFEA